MSERKTKNKKAKREKKVNLPIVTPLVFSDVLSDRSLLQIREAVQRAVLPSDWVKGNAVGSKPILLMKDRNDYYVYWPKNQAIGELLLKTLLYLRTKNTDYPEDREHKHEEIALCCLSEYLLSQDYNDASQEYIDNLYLKFLGTSNENDIGCFAQVDMLNRGEYEFNRDQFDTFLYQQECAGYF